MKATILRTIHSINRSVKPHDVIRMLDGTYHYCQYVNSSGAYVVPLAAITRIIAGHQAQFTAGGRTISANSAVEVVDPLEMGGNSQEYARYVKMSGASREDGMAKRVKKALAANIGATFNDFDTAELDIDPADGHAAEAATVTAPTKADTNMAKKAAKTAAKAPKAAKTPKAVSNCVCGCGTETTGNFAPGHDARFHGWIKKLADGRIQKNGKDTKSGEVIIGASVLNKLGLVAKGDGFKATTPEYYKS